MEELAPIVLFVYNRPSHTLQTLESLKGNVLSSKSTLYIFADGPKKDATEEQLLAINEVRTIVAQEQWCARVEIVAMNENKGLYRSVRDGVTEIVSRHGRVIVLEDDLQLSPYFLTYMNDALAFYAHKPSVFSISGYNYPQSCMPIPTDYTYDTYVSLRNASWGWATWADRWSTIDWDVDVYDTIANDKYIRSALNRMGDDEFDLLYLWRNGTLNIWSIQFTIAHFVHHAVAIYPTVSFVNNIGNDGSGENCGVTNRLANKTLNNKSSYQFVEVLYEDSRLINAFYNVNCRTPRPLWQKACNWIARRFGKNLPFVIKKYIYTQE